MNWCPNWPAAPRQRPVARFVAGLLQELAFCGGAWILVGFDIAGRHREGDRPRSVLVRTDQYELVTLGHRDDRGEVARAYREERVDLAAIGKRDALLGDLHPGRTGARR